MPDRQLAHRAGLLYATPTGEALSFDERDALQVRIERAETLADLPEADQELLRQAALEVSAGRSTLSDVESQGDWQAIDVAIDDDDPVALELALDTVGRGPEVIALGGDARLLPPLGSGEAPADDTSNDNPDDLDDEPYDVPDPDDTAWVGL